MPSSCKNQYLYFTGIGYQKDSVLIQDIQYSLSIRLKPKTYRLTEVYVIPDSTLLTLLRRAYNKIPDNYPTVPTLYEGFYRESTQNNEKEQANFIEAVLSVYKDPYNKPSSALGQIEILKSRKKEIRNTGVLYYGGPSLVVREDIVLSRADFISPRYFKDYKYEFNGIKTLGNEKFYEISFTKTTKGIFGINGTMLIEKESLAYVSFDINKDIEVLHPRIKARKSYKKVQYEMFNNKWYLKYYTYRHEDFPRFNDKIIHGAIDYVTTYIKIDSVIPIPYERQLQVLDPLIIKAEEYNPNGWTDYDILKNTTLGTSNFQFSENESAEIFTQQNSLKTNTIGKFVKIRPFLSRFYYDIGISYKPVSITTVNHIFSFHLIGDNSPFMINKNQKKKSEYVLLQNSIGYRFDKNISVAFQTSSDIFDKSISSNEHYIGATYQKNIKPTGRPLLLQGSLMFGLKNYYVDLGKYDNPSVFHYKGTKIDASKISFDYGKRQKTITLQIALTRNMNRFFSLKTYIGYNINLHSKNVFRVKEEKGNIFTKEKVTLSADDPNLQFNDNNRNIWDSFSIHKWQTGINLVFN
jgi:hypothetical protein